MGHVSSRLPRVGRAAAPLLLIATALGANCGVGESGSPTAQEPSVNAPPQEPVAEAASAVSGCVTIRRGLFGEVEDALIESDPTKATKNYGASASLSAGGGASPRHALVKWDLSFIPSDATVTSATATLSVPLYGGAPVHGHRAVAPWSESTVSWSGFADAVPAQPASVEFPAVTGNASSPVPTSADVTQVVQDWVSGASQNHGLLLERDDAAGDTVFASSEWATETERPTLQVCYVAPPSLVPGASRGRSSRCPGSRSRSYRARRWR
ncbi:MAG: DNRLRE domain-containing protein [Minicystis sp.]